VHDDRSVANWLRPFLVLATVSLVTVALWWAQKVLIPVALALLLAFVLTPVVSWLERRGLGRTPAAVVAVLLALALLTGIGLLIAWQLRGLASDWPRYQAQISQKIDAFREAVRGTFLENLTAELPPGADQTFALGIVQQVAWPATEALASALLILVLVFFMLLGREDLRNRVVRLFGHGQLVSTTRALDDSAHRLSRYLLMQSCTNITVGTLLAVGLSLMHVPYALLWGFLAAVLRFIPYLGTWSVALLLAVFCVATSGGWAEPLMAFGYFALIELLMSQVFEPLLFGHMTGVSTLPLIIAITFWTWLWGPIGLMLAIPLTTCLAVLGKYLPQLEFLYVLLGAEPVLDEETTYYQRLLAHDQDEAVELVEDFVEKQPPEQVYDRLLVPALCTARSHRDEGKLEAGDERFVQAVTRSIVDDVLAPEVEAAAGGDGAGAGTAERPGVRVFGCSAHDGAEELALRMFRQVLGPAGSAFEVLSANVLSSEVVERAAAEGPAVVLIAALPPGGLAQALYLCKRLRRRFPDLKLLVGRWGQKDMPPRVHERLTRAGASHVDTTLLASRDRLLPLVQAASRTPLPQEEEAVAMRCPVRQTAAVAGKVEASVKRGFRPGQWRDT
jgi:predicted PurR-regulated permease PerM